MKLGGRKSFLGLFANTLGFTFLSVVHGSTQADVKLTAIPVASTDPTVVLGRIQYSLPADGSAPTAQSAENNRHLAHLLGVMSSSPTLSDTLFSLLDSSEALSPLDLGAAGRRNATNALKVALWRAMQEQASGGPSALNRFASTLAPSINASLPVVLSPGGFEAAAVETQVATSLKKTFRSQIKTFPLIPATCQDLEKCIRAAIDEDENTSQVKQALTLTKSPAYAPVFAQLQVSPEHSWTRLDVTLQRSVPLGYPVVQFKFAAKARPSLPLELTLGTNIYHLLSVNYGGYVRGLDGNFYRVSDRDVCFVHSDAITSPDFDVSSVVYAVDAALAPEHTGFERASNDFRWTWINVLFVSLAAFFGAILLGSLSMLLYDRYYHQKKRS